MKAAVYYGRNDIRVEEREVPEIGRNDILVRVKTCGICGSDNRAFRKGSNYIVPPRILGHEIAGEIVRVGADVSKFDEGMFVTIAPGASCGECFFCRNCMETLCSNRIIIGVNLDGGFAEFLKIPANYVKAVFSFKKELSFEEAAMIEPLSCCLHGILKIPIKPGDSTVIVGDGPIGLLHLQLAKLRGAYTFVCGLSEHRLQKAEELGADEIINARTYDPITFVKAATNDLGADVVIVAASSPNAVEQGIKMVRKGGYVLLFAGVPHGAETLVDANLIHYSEINVTGSVGSGLETFEKALRLVERRKIITRPLITHKFKLEQISEALDAVDRLEGIKVLVTP